MRKITMYIALGLILALVGRLLILLIPGSGQFTEFETIAADQCMSIEVAPGPEDIQIDHDTGLAYISVADRRDTSPDRHAGIYMLDLNDPHTPPRKLEGEYPDGFYPHGISLWQGPSGERRLFVVNHPHGKHSVEIFRLDATNRLSHLDTITSEKFTFPNDIVAVGEREFYVTNMQRASGGIALTLELYLGLPVTDVVYFDGSEATQAATGLITANGINVSADDSELYVAEVIAQRINVYQRDQASGKLNERKRIAIGTGPDNIDVAPDGSLYIGAHPNLLAFTKHAADENAISPSQVVRLDTASGEYKTVFMSVNGEIDGSATGPYWRGNLLVGSVFESQVLWCSPI